jgi:hypothetical protein
MPDEAVGLDAMGDPLYAGHGPNVGREPVGVGARHRDGWRLHRDDDVVQLTEFAQVLLVALDVALMRRQELTVGYPHALFIV